MSLTHEDLAQLKAWFEPNEHEFIRGFAYLQEDPITERIESVDPAWHMTEPFISIRDAGFTDNKTGVVSITTTVTVKLGITIKGVTRWGVGSAIVDSGRAEAEKSAATDALKRASRLFGIGRYLLTLPDTVKNVSQLSEWMSKTGSKSPQNAVSGDKPTTQSPKPTKPENAPKNDIQAQNAPEGSHWIDNDKLRKDFFRWLEQRNVSEMEAKAILQVENFHDYTGHTGNAKTTINAYLTENTTREVYN